MQQIQWYPGHMAKTRRLIEENLKLIDVVVEILDARIPFSGRNTNFNDILKYFIKSKLKFIRHCRGFQMKTRYIHRACLLHVYLRRAYL